MRGGIPRINRARFLRLFRELSGIGASEDGSVHRPALSEAHLEARKLLVEKLSSLGGSGAVSVKCQLDKLYMTLEVAEIYGARSRNKRKMVEAVKSAIRGC